MTNSKKHITILVSNDLEHDQRVAKVCNTLIEMGFELTLVGRLLPDSKPFERPYTIRRFRLPFRTGALFYAALNVRLFFYLLFNKTDILVANDLDTLLPAYIVSRLRGKALVYDSHEYFTEAEGLTNRPAPKKVWLTVERFIFPKLKHVITVNNTIADIYRNLYGVPVEVVRNVPQLRSMNSFATRGKLHLPEDKRIVLLQGAYIDPDRGGMELALSMELLDDTLLLIIGSGRDLDNIKREVAKRNLTDRVRFIPKLPFQELQHYTAVADVGVSLDKPVHLNYAYSLPNKLFDYIHAGLPVLVSDLPELKRIIEEYNVGVVVSKVEPREIAQSLRYMFNDELLTAWKKNALSAAQILNWQREQQVLHRIYSSLR
jgi:glycosyltransferase involved in cell wall biosynthesis